MVPTIYLHRFPFIYECLLLQVPTSYQKSFVVWIRVKGDWTEAIEKMLNENGSQNIR